MPPMSSGHAAALGLLFAIGATSASADGKYALVSGSEGDGPEGGGRMITVVDLTARKALHHLELAWGRPGFPCPPNPIPHAGPSLAFGCFTDTNGVAISPRHGGILFTANGGAHDVSVIDVAKTFAGGLGAEVARLALATPDGRPSRPRGIAITPDGRYAAITGAPRGQPGSSMLWVVDIAQRKTIGRVSGVGNETYLLALLP